MKNKKTIAAMLMLVICFTAVTSFAQTKTESSTTKSCCMNMMKDCCVMKDGKMMMMKDGKMMSMDKDMTMKNGTKCMVNGECVMKNGKKMKMKEGQCMDMDGKMSNCQMMKDGESKAEKKTEKSDAAIVYTCPMHPEVISDKPGKCPKCGMDLVKKK